MNRILENRRGISEEVIRRIEGMFERLEEKCTIKTKKIIRIQRDKR